MDLFWIYPSVKLNVLNKSLGNDMFMSLFGYNFLFENSVTCTLWVKSTVETLVYNRC
jgi:hypothetical protein